MYPSGPEAKIRTHESKDVSYFISKMEGAGRQVADVAILQNNK